MLRYDYKNLREVLSCKDFKELSQLVVRRPLVYHVSRYDDIDLLSLDCLPCFAFRPVNKLDTALFSWQQARIFAEQAKDLFGIVSHDDI